MVFLGGVATTVTIVTRNMLPEVYGLYLFVFSTLCASTMGVCAKLAGNRGIPVFEIVLARSVVLALLTLPQLIQKRINPFSSERKALLLLRGLLGFGAVSSLYWAVQLLPIADAAVLQFLAPIIVAALSPLLLKELPCLGVWIALPMCIVGVVLVSQPTFLFGGLQAVPAAGVAIGIFQAVFSASAKMCIRSLGSTEPVQTIVASMAAVSIAGSALLCAALPGHFVVPRDATTWALLAAAGLLGFGNQMLSTTSLKLASAAPAVAMSYIGVLWGMLADLVIFHDAPGPLSLAGAAVVCCSSYVVVRSEQQRGPGMGRGAAAGGAGGGRGSKQGASSSGKGNEEERVELIEAGGYRRHHHKSRGSSSGDADEDSAGGLGSGEGGKEEEEEEERRGLLLGAQHSRSAPALLPASHGSTGKAGGRA